MCLKDEEDDGDYVEEEEDEEDGGTYVSYFQWGDGKMVVLIDQGWSNCLTKGQN